MPENVDNETSHWKNTFSISILETMHKMSIKRSGWYQFLKSIVTEDDNIDSYHALEHIINTPVYEHVAKPKHNLRIRHRYVAQKNAYMYYKFYNNYIGDRKPVITSGK